MWNYEKRLEYPIKIKQTNPTLAAMIISQYGGPDGELGASMRYISQRYSMPYREVAGLLTDIVEDMAAEQKARTTYDNLIRLAKDDPDVLDPLKFLREREIVHFQRFGEALSIIQSKLDCNNYYLYNPEFDKNCNCIKK